MTPTESSRWADPKVILPLINMAIGIIGFVSVYAVTTTKLQDAVAVAGAENAATRAEIVEIHRRAQAIADALVMDRGLTSNRLTSIESDIKYIGKSLDEIKAKQDRNSNRDGSNFAPH